MDNTNNSSKKRIGLSRKKVITEALIAFCAGLALMFLFKKVLMGKIVLGISGFVLITGNFIPPAYRAFKFLVDKLALFIVVGITWILLVPFFYIVFTLGRLILFVSGKDPMNRKFPSDQESCWISVKQERDLDRYERQY